MHIGIVNGRVLALAGAIFLSSSTATAASVAYTYDSAGRVATALYDNGTCLVYTYDATGNRTSQVLQSGSPLTPTWGTGIYGCFKSSA